MARTTAAGQGHPVSVRSPSAMLRAVPAPAAPSERPTVRVETLDFTSRAPLRTTVERVLPASPEQVFDALADSITFLRSLGETL